MNISKNIGQNNSPMMPKDISYFTLIWIIRINFPIHYETKMKLNNTSIDSKFRIRDLHVDKNNHYCYV